MRNWKHVLTLICILDLLRRLLLPQHRNCALRLVIIIIDTSAVILQWCVLIYITFSKHLRLF